MEFFEVSRHISADPDQIWSVLTNAETLVEGDFGITRLDGDIALGERIKLWADVSDRPFSLTVTEFAPPKRMVWRGGMPFGLFRGERTFELNPTGGGTAFKMREEFSGLLLPLIWKSMPDLNPAFDQFANALQLHSEAS